MDQNQTLPFRVSEATGFTEVPSPSLTFFLSSLPSLNSSRFLAFASRSPVTSLHPQAPSDWLYQAAEEHFPWVADAPFIFHLSSRSGHPLPIPSSHSSTFPPADSSASTMFCWGMAGVFLKQDHLGSDTEPAHPQTHLPPSHPALKQGLPLGKQWAQRGSNSKSLSPALKPWPDTISSKKKKNPVEGGLLGTHN